MPYQWRDRLSADRRRARPWVRLVAVALLVLAIAWLVLSEHSPLGPILQVFSW
jgi:hypothetical protein